MNMVEIQLLDCLIYGTLRSGLGLHLNEVFSAFPVADVLETHVGNPDDGGRDSGSPRTAFLDYNVTSIS
jgi:hypothetical protein